MSANLNRQASEPMDTAEDKKETEIEAFQLSGGALPNDMDQQACASASASASAENGCDGVRDFSRFPRCSSPFTFPLGSTYPSI